MAVAALVGTSAFADSRHSNETHSRATGRGSVDRSGVSARGESRSAPAPAPQAPAVSSDRGSRSWDRSSGQRSQTPEQRDARTWDRSSASPQAYNRGNNDRNHSNGSWDRNRSNDTNRNGSWDRNHDSRGNNNNWRNDSRSRGGSYDHRQRYYGHGRISNVLRWNNGYRIWIVGSPYPFYVPLAYYNSHRFGIGLSVNLGGYYNPLGYYDYDNGYYGTSATSAGALRGVVESVDYRRNTFVIRNDATGSYVTVEMRDRYDDNVRPGDFVELTGDWSRNGVFVAYDINRTDAEYR